MDSAKGLSKEIHCMGLGGVGVAALARHFLNQGYTVSGCDAVESSIIQELKKQGVVFSLGHDLHHITSNVESVVYSDAVPYTHEELEYARKRGVGVATYARALGEITSSYRTIAVAGTNGKSTTTSLVGLILERAGLDPTVVVGGKVPMWQGGYRPGRSEYFVTEADEYNKHFLELHPESIVITNIEAEHLDVYSGIEELEETFLKFVRQNKHKGHVVMNADDPRSTTICSKISTMNMHTYGIGEHADMRLVKREVGDGVQECICRYQDEDIHFRIHVPGLFNVYNVMGAATLALLYGVARSSVVEVVDSFKGIGRRFERIGMWHGADVISDYAHHPTSVEATIKATQEFFPGRRIISIFQPHQQARTRIFRHEFARALSCASRLILMEVYGVIGREEGEKISSKDVMRDIHGPSPLHYALNIDEVRELLEQEAKQEDVLLFMGAGDIDKGVRDFFKE